MYSNYPFFGLDHLVIGIDLTICTLLVLFAVQPFLEVGFSMHFQFYTKQLLYQYHYHQYTILTLIWAVWWWQIRLRFLMLLIHPVLQNSSCATSGVLKYIDLVSKCCSSRDIGSTQKLTFKSDEYHANTMSCHKYHLSTEVEASI